MNAGSPPSVQRRSSAPLTDRPTLQAIHELREALTRVERLKLPRPSMTLGELRGHQRSLNRAVAKLTEARAALDELLLEEGSER